MPTAIIAEVASNHGGDLNLARQFVHHSAAAGASFVKFQSWRAATVRAGDAQIDWFRQSELSDQGHRELIDTCREHGVRFLTTCFDVSRIDFLASLGLTDIKVGSADLGSERMLKTLRDRFDHVIVSTGLATDDEVARTAEWLSGGRFTFLHCVSKYPVPVNGANLNRMIWLRQFTPSVGWSDHAEGLEVAHIAIAMGADYIEKHVCLGRQGPGRVMPWDATPDELGQLAAAARRVERIRGSMHPGLDDALLAARRSYVGRFGDNA